MIKSCARLAAAALAGSAVLVGNAVAAGLPTIALGATAVSRGVRLLTAQGR